MVKFVSRAKTDYLIIHCSDTYEDMDTSAADIDLWHRQRGFTAIGYHYVIRIDGRIEVGRPEDAIGAHCRAKGRNRDSIGICLIGGKSKDNDGPEDNFTGAQLVSLRRLIAQLTLKYPHAQIKGHRDFERGKTCPAFDYEAVLYGDIYDNSLTFS